MAATTSLTFLNTGSPTGLKFAVEHGGMRALFDFGVEHAPGRAPFSMGLRPRPGRELSDLLAVGSAPRLDGVYAGGDWDRRTSLFISHMHLDHTSLVRFLHPDLPLYYPAAMEPLRAAADAGGYLPWRSPAGTPVGDRVTVRWGEIEVTFIEVDHDVPGSSGFLVRTPDLTIAYTGDHRWHGLHPEVTAAYAAAVRGVDVLIQEAVTLGLDPAPEAEIAPPPRLSEGEVIEALRGVLERPGLVVVNLYPMNRERVAGLATAAAAAGRRLVLEPVAALLAGRPELAGDLAAARADPRGHAVQLSFESLPELIDLRPPLGSVYVHSNGPPLGPFDPGWRVMEAWVSAMSLEYAPVGTTGHSFPEDIARMVREVAPGVVVPVHSRRPEALVVPGVRRLVPQVMRPYTAADLAAAAELPA